MKFKAHELPLRASLAAFGLALGLLCTATAQAAAKIDGDSAKAIKGTTKVAIAEFGVEFYTQMHGQGQAGGAVASVTAELAGVSDATMQAITDQAYAETLAALQAAGFEVLDQATLLAAPGYQELAEKYGAASPYTLTDDSFGQRAPSLSKIFAPAGMKAFFSSSVLRGDMRQRIDVQNQGRGHKEGELAKSLGVTLLHVHYLAAFGIVSGTKNGFLAGIAGKARAAIEPQPLLYPEETEIQFVTEAGERVFTNSKRPRHSGAVYLDAPLIAATNIYTSHETTPAETKRGNAVFNAVGGLLGSSAREKTKTSEVAAESEEAYRNTYQALICEATTAMVGALAAAR